MNISWNMICTFYSNKNNKFFWMSAPIGINGVVTLYGYILFNTSDKYLYTIIV